MNDLRKKLLNSILFSVVVIFGLMATLSVSASLADQSEPKSPRTGWNTTSGTATISVGDFTAQIVGRGEVLHILFWNESDPEVKYIVNFVSLIEFEDLNQDGAFQPNEMREGPMTTGESQAGGPETTGESQAGGPETTGESQAGGPETTGESQAGGPETTGESQTGGPETTGESQTILSLAKVDWTFSGFQNDTDEQGETVAVHFNFTSVEINDPIYSNVELQIQCHLYLANQELDLDGATYSILGSAELKFDIMIANWPWTDPNNLLTLRFLIKPVCDTPNRHCTPVAEEFQARNKLNVNEAMNQAQRFRGTAEPKQQFSFEVENRVTSYFAFANKVKVKNNNTEAFKTVECSYMTDGSNVQVYLTFPHFDLSIYYDPSVGIGDQSSPFEIQRAPKTGWDATNGTVTVLIGDLSVQVVGRGEVFHILFWNESDPEVKYTVNFVSLIEFEDLNQDGVFQLNETQGNSGTSGDPLTVLPLAKVDWIFEGFQNDTDEQGGTTAVHFNFTSADINDPDYNNVELQIRCHLYLADQELDLDGAIYPLLGSTELKFDIIIANWPWTNPDNLLTLRFQIRPVCYTPNRLCTPVAEEFQAQNKLNVSEAMKQAQRFRGTAEPKQQFSFEVENQVAAYFAFANRVMLKSKNAESFGTVECSYMTDGTNVQVYLTFPHFEESIVYDPSVGIVSSSISPETTTTHPETSASVSEFEYTTLFFVALILLFGIAIPIKKR